MQVSPSSLLLVRSGHMVFDHVTPDRLLPPYSEAPPRLALDRSPETSASVRFAPVKLAPIRWASSRSEPVKLALLKSSPLRFAPLRGPGPFHPGVRRRSIRCSSVCPIRHYRGRCPAPGQARVPPGRSVRLLRETRRPSPGVVRRCRRVGKLLCSRQTSSQIHFAVVPSSLVPERGESQ